MGRLQNLFQRPDTAVYDALEDAQDDNDSAYREDGNEDDGVEEEGDIQPDDAHDLAPPFSRLEYSIFVLQGVAMLWAW